MFNEDEDWNDAADILSVGSLQKKPKDSTSGNSKSVGKKSLLRTLQTLGSVPDWKGDVVGHPPDSDSEAEATGPHAKTRKKKRKRRKQTTTTGEQNKVDVKEEKIVTKKRTVVPKACNTPAGQPEDKETPTLENKARDVQKLSRQQWKNKMKNKKNCKNKYRRNNPEVEVKAANKPPLTTTRISDDKKSNPTEMQDEKKSKKPQKRKNTDEDVETLQRKTAKNEAIISKEENTVVNGSKKEADESKGKPQKPKTCRAEMQKREHLRKILQHRETEQEEAAAAEPVSENVAAGEEVKPDRSTSLRSRMVQRLESARFRYINEVLYTSTSGEATRMFRQDPDAFWIYHRGYTAQVQRWPTNPVDAIIAYIRQKPSSLVVADFGCGDCKIGRSVKNKVHSFDLAATCDLVTVCDMADVPLEDSSVDIVVFCLSLMGTNLADFLAEANRVLKKGGALKVAEVASRFDNVRSFINALANLGFKMVSKDTENSHFYLFEFTKTGNAPEKLKKFGLQLKACLYKKR